jgi:hypothetical protein
MKQRQEIEEKKLGEFDRMFGQRRANVYFLFSIDRTGELLGLTLENLHNFPNY